MRYKERAKWKKFTRQKLSISSSSENDPPISAKDPKCGETPPKIGETSIPPPSTHTIPKSEISFKRFASIEIENANRNIFSHKPVLGKREVSINNFPTPKYALIKQIFVERQWKKITQAGPSPLVEVAREFYSNLSPFNVEEYGMSLVVRGTTIEISPSILRNHFELTLV